MHVVASACACMHLHVSCLLAFPCVLQAVVEAFMMWCVEGIVGMCSAVFVACSSVVSSCLALLVLWSVVVQLFPCIKVELPLVLNDQLFEQVWSLSPVSVLLLSIGACAAGILHGMLHVLCPTALQD